MTYPIARPSGALARRHRDEWLGHGKVLAVLAVLSGTVGPSHAVAARPDWGVGPYDGRLEADFVSRYSHIRVRRQANVRALLFVRDSGEEVVETYLNLDRPHELITEYTQFMFVSYLSRPRPKRVLLVGLGGGSMVHFLKAYDPQVELDVVEIDQAIVDVAKKYFLVREDEKTKIIVSDAVTYLTGSPPRYDVVYMDAFLKPSRQTDSTGAPLKLKAGPFQRDILRKALAPDGMAVFNINAHAGVADDIASISATFPQTYVYRLSGATGYVVAATADARRETPAALAERAREIDRRFQASFSFERMADRLLPERRRAKGR